MNEIPLLFEATVFFQRKMKNIFGRRIAYNYCTDHVCPVPIIAISKTVAFVLLPKLAMSASNKYSSLVILKKNNLKLIQNDKSAR